MSQRASVPVAYYSDVLCIWAYVAQVKVDELKHNFGDRVTIENRFVSVFGSVRSKLEGWAQRGGAEGYARHVLEIAAGFDHVQVHEGVWTRCVPAGSSSAHAFVKAADLLVAEGSLPAQPQEAYAGRTPVEELTWRLRLAFFRDLHDIATLEVQMQVAADLGLPTAELRSRCENGTAAAALSEDYEAASRDQVTGSPTLLLNEGRQKLYGNVGYGVIEANIQELLRDHTDRASWC